MRKVTIECECDKCHKEIPDVDYKKIILKDYMYGETIGFSEFEKEYQYCCDCFNDIKKYLDNLTNKIRRKK